MAARRSGIDWRGRSAAWGTGFALVASLGAGLLAMWGLWWASSPVLPEQPPVAAENAELHSTGWAILIASVALAMVIALDLARPNAKQSRGGLTTLAAAVAGVVLLVSGWNLASRVDFTLSSYPATSQGPALLAAGGLAVAACLIAFITGWLVTDDSSGWARGWLAIGAAVGVTLSAVLALGAVSTGDDSRHIDATTAVETTVPAVPARLGDERFSIDTEHRVDPSNDDPPAWIAPGGAGFFVLGDDGVRAYDSAGNERWHYIRTGPKGVVAVGMRVYEDDGTVLVRYSHVERANFVDFVVSLDVLTGERLWRADDFNLRYSLVAPTALRGSSPFMIVEDDQRAWTRVDTRTGQTMWAIDMPDCRYEAATTPGRLSYVSLCADGAAAALRLVSVDAETGRAVIDKVISRVPLVDNPETARDTLSLVRFRVLPGSDQVLAVTTGTGWRAVDLSTGAMSSTFGRPEEFLGDPGLDLIAEKATAIDSLELRSGPDAAVRCAIPQRHRQGRPLAWLGDEVVILATPKDIVAYSRSDCAAGARRVPAQGEPVQLIPAPGVLLVVRFTGDRAVIDGYGP